MEGMGRRTSFSTTRRCLLFDEAIEARSHDNSANSAWFEVKTICNSENAGFRTKAEENEVSVPKLGFSNIH